MIALYVVTSIILFVYLSDSSSATRGGFIGCNPPTKFFFKTYCGGHLLWCVFLSIWHILNNYNNY